MTTTPASRLSPMAGLLNAMARLYIRRALPIVAAQQQAVDEASNLNHRLHTTRNFTDSDNAGYIDRSFLEA